MHKIIIVGATTGIGRAMANYWVNKGHAVGITGRTAVALQSYAQQHAGKPVFTRCWDAAAPDSLSQLQILIDQMGGVDIWVYCAGGGDVNPRLDPRQELDMFGANASGFVALAPYMYNYFVQQGHGHLAVISSVAANRGLQAAPVYSASKAFVSNYAEALWIRARKLKHPVKITDIQPGFVDSRQNHKPHFWWVPLPKAATQIAQAIEQGKKRAYISRRWALAAWLMRQLPAGVLSKIT